PDVAGLRRLHEHPASMSDAEVAEHAFAARRDKTGSDFLPHHLQRLQHWHPDVTIELHEQERQAIEQGLLEGRFDMAVVLTANLTHPDIVSQTLFNSERRLWLPAHHPLCERSSISLADVAEEPFIQPGRAAGDPCR
ncbi:LysR substrate-binding domain-containing protein, partial [Burkholderia sp. SIMBA_019]|uniref:LysR substrate-binding domain-containing protein n=1 Tax=Burkholderia sp. SIMBA_019 TaxID=3085765 RepID=UPI00397A7D03